MPENPLIQKACSNLREKYETDCPNIWVSRMRIQPLIVDADCFLQIFTTQFSDWLRRTPVSFDLKKSTGPH